MEPRLSAFKEYENHEDAERAVRALREAGFDYVETANLSDSLQEISDVGVAPPKIAATFEWTGFAYGIGAGFVLGLILFGVPVTIVETPYAPLVVIWGTIAMTIVGAVIGVQESFKWSKRAATEPTSSKGGHRSVGVRVRAEHGADIVRAKDILEQFGPPEWGEKVRRFRARSWIRNRRDSLGARL